MTSEFFMNHQIFEQNHEATLGGADGKEQVDHADDGVIAAQHKDAAAVWLFENQAQPAQLLFLVRSKVALFAEQLAEQIGQLIQISLGRRFDHYVVAHRLLVIPETGGAGNPRMKDR